MWGFSCFKVHLRRKSDNSRRRCPQQKKETVAQKIRRPCNGSPDYIVLFLLNRHQPALKKCLHEQITSTLHQCGQGNMHMFR